MEAARTVTACMLVIGNEILSGRTRDANLHYVAGRLTELGVRLTEARFVPDVHETIVAAVNECRARFDYVFTSGGIGPTHDDITADAIAAAFGVGISVDPRARAMLEAQVGRDNLNEARLRMARIPHGAALIDNPVSRAPGFRLENVYVMAGVPDIMRAMFESVRHELVGGPKLLSRTVGAALPEGLIAAPLRALQERYADLEIGSYPSFRQGRPSTAMVLRGTDAGRLAAAAEELKREMRALGAEPTDSGG